MTLVEPERDDHELVEALRDGDADAFREIVTELSPGLARVARMYVTPAIADEAVQETWASVVRSIDRFQERSSLKTWVYRILLNKVRTLGPRESRVVPFATLGRNNTTDEAGVDIAERLLSNDAGRPAWPVAADAFSQLPLEQLESAETLMMIEEAIAALPTAQREVVEMRDILGLSAKETAEMLGISDANQRVLLHRGRVAVRKMLEEYLNG